MMQWGANSGEELPSVLWVIGEVEGAAREGVLTEEGVSFNIESGIHCTLSPCGVGARLALEACLRLATMQCHRDS